MIIRREEEKEFDKIHELVKTAFETAAVKDGDEQEYVRKLRKSENYLPPLALVAEEGGELIGHIMFTKMKIGCGEKIYEELLLSPICVELSHRNRGIGGALIKRGFEIAKEMGYTAVFLVGDPLYYSRFGFKETTCFGIKNEGDIPEKYIMACELYDDALKGKNGKISIV